MRIRATKAAMVAGGSVAVMALVAFALYEGVAGATPSVPDELAVRGVTFRAAQDAGISEADAILTARREAGLGDGVAAKAVLVFATDPMLASAESAIQDRKVWVVLFDGLSQYVPGPATANGEPAPGHWIHKGFSYVDAETGSYLATVWTQ